MLNLNVVSQVSGLIYRLLNFALGGFMDIDSFIKKWQGHIYGRYASHCAEPMIIDMYNDLIKLVIMAQSKLATAAREFIDIDDEIHSASEGDEWKIIENRAKIYTNRRRTLLLAMNPPNKQINPTLNEILF